MTEPPDLPGLSFERVLGSGGYSDVYLYQQQLPLRHVAVKVLKNSGLAEGLRSELTTEANTMAGLADHPNIVPVFSAAVSSDGRPYIVMSYYSRPNLAVRAASERLGVAEVLRIGIQIASAVETAHRAGILHRDIKPANVLTNQFGVPGLTDFGIAGAMAAEDDADAGVSVPWTAPEVLYATEPSSVRSDVYALAATLWHLLVGRSPFEVRGGDNSTFELMRRIRDTPPPATGRADVPEGLERLLRQAMAKDPRARPASAIDLARGLQAVEIELHLPRTDIVVLTEHAGPAPTPPGDPQTPHHPAAAPPGAGFSPTVARPASHPNQAQPPAAPWVPAAAQAAQPEHPGAVPPTVARPAVVRSQPTIGRAPVVIPDSPAPGPPPGDDTASGGNPRQRTYLWTAAVAVVAAGAVVGGFAAFGVGSDAGGHPAPTVSRDPGTQNAVITSAVAPGIPTVVGTRAADGRLRFSWSYSAPRPGDTYEWRETRGGTLHNITTKPTLTLPKPARPTTVCIQVRVVRADGSNASPRYSPEGCIRR